MFRGWNLEIHHISSTLLQLANYAVTSTFPNTFIIFLSEFFVKFRTTIFFIFKTGPTQKWLRSSLESL